MQRLPGLDVLRAVAIVWVMLFHSWVIGGLSQPFEGLQNTGWMGVDLFFVLSGYLIGGQLLRPLSNGLPLDFRTFYLRRSFRILPAYLVVLGLYFLAPGRGAAVPGHARSGQAFKTKLIHADSVNRRDGHEPVVWTDG